MQYTKALVDLIQEARRRAPSKDKPSIKLANPDVLFELIKIYHASKDIVFRTLVKEIMEQAGEPWPVRLETLTDKPEEREERSWLKVYRGQASIENKSIKAKDSKVSEKTDSRPKRIYRGQVIA